MYRAQEKPKVTKLSSVSNMTLLAKKHKNPPAVQRQVLEITITIKK
jgi:hypothetical protein